MLSFFLCYDNFGKTWSCQNQDKRYEYLETDGSFTDTVKLNQFNSYRNMIRVLKNTLKRENCELVFCCDKCKNMAKTGNWDDLEEYE